MKLEHTMMIMGRKNVKLSHLLQNSATDVWMARCAMGWKGRLSLGLLQVLIGVGWWPLMCGVEQPSRTWETLQLRAISGASCAERRQRTVMVLALFSCNAASGRRAGCDRVRWGVRRRWASERTGRRAGRGCLRCGARGRRRDGGAVGSAARGDGSGWDRREHQDLLRPPTVRNPWEAAGQRRHALVGTGYHRLGVGSGSRIYCRRDLGSLCDSSTPPFTTLLLI
jgi:hypothetical protein